MRMSIICLRELARNKIYSPQNSAGNFLLNQKGEVFIEV